MSERIPMTNTDEQIVQHALNAFSNLYEREITIEEVSIHYSPRFNCYIMEYFE